MGNKSLPPGFTTWAQVWAKIAQHYNRNKPFEKVSFASDPDTEYTVIDIMWNVIDEAQTSRFDLIESQQLIHLLGYAHQDHKIDHATMEELKRKTLIFTDG